MRYSDVISLGMLLGQRLRERLRERPHLLLQRPAHDRDVDVDALGAGRLDERRHAERLERVTHDERAARSTCANFTPGPGIEIEMQVVGAIDVVAARVPLIEIDAAEVDDPEQRREVLHHREVDHVPRLVLDRAGLDPLGMRLGDALHEEAFPLRAVRVALHHHRPIAQVRQQRGGDVGVVLEQIALRDPRVAARTACPGS